MISTKDRDQNNIAITVIVMKNKNCNSFIQFMPKKKTPQLNQMRGIFFFLLSYECMILKLFNSKIIFSIPKSKFCFSISYIFSATKQAHWKREMHGMRGNETKCSLPFHQKLFPPYPPTLNRSNPPFLSICRGIGLGFHGVIYTTLSLSLFEN